MVDVGERDVANVYAEWNDVARPRDLDGSTKQSVLNVQHC